MGTVGLASPIPIWGAETGVPARFCFLREKEPWPPDLPIFQEMPEIWISSWSKSVPSQAEHLRDSMSCHVIAKAKLSLLEFIPMLSKTQPQIGDSLQAVLGCQCYHMSITWGSGHGELLSRIHGPRAILSPSCDGAHQNFLCSQVQLCPELRVRKG